MRCAIFFYVNVKSVREPIFVEIVHGHFFAFTDTFSWRFTNKWMCSRTVFIACSRPLLEVHGQFLFNMYTGTFKGSRPHCDFKARMFTDTFPCSRPLFHVDRQFYYIMRARLLAQFLIPWKSKVPMKTICGPFLAPLWTMKGRGLKITNNWGFSKM